MCVLAGCGQTKDLIGTLTDTAKFGLAGAKENIPKATSALQGPLSLFQALLSGDRNTIMSILSPEISTLSSQYDTGRKTAEEFSPRGGGRASTLEELPFQKAGEIEKLVSGARVAGAEGVTKISQLLADIGIGELTGSTSAGTSALSAINQQQQNNANAGAGLGSAVGSFFALLAGL